MLSVKLNDEKIKNLKIKIKKLQNGTNNIIPKGKGANLLLKSPSLIFPNNKILKDLNIDISNELVMGGLIEHQSPVGSNKTLKKVESNTSLPRKTNSKEEKDKEEEKKNDAEKNEGKETKEIKDHEETKNLKDKSPQPKKDDNTNLDQGQSNEINSSALGLKKKKSSLYEPNLNPTFTYKRSLIQIPTNDHEKMKEIDRLQNEISQLKANHFEKLYEDFCFFLELDNPKQYRSKLIGFNIPFRSDKASRISQAKSKSPHYLIDPKTNEEIKRIVNIRKEEKKLLLKEMEQYQRIKYYEERQKLQMKYEQKKKQAEKLKLNRPDGADFNYSDIKRKHDIYDREKSQKLTWDQLEKLNSNHFVTNREDDFKPEDILDVDYDSDDAKTFMEMKQQADARNKEKNLHSSTVLKSFSSQQSANLANKNTIRESQATDTTKFENLINLDVSRINNVNDSKSLHDNSNLEKRAKEKEKLWEDKRQKLLNKYDNLVKKGMEKVQKHKKSSLT